MAAPVRFDPDDPLPGLEGLSSEFIADLHDLVAKYGADVRGVEGLRRIGLPTPRPSQVTVTVPPSAQRNMTVRPVPADEDVSAICIMLLGDETDSYILWDRRCTVADVRDAMARVDAEMAAFRDPATGTRMRIASDTYAPPPLSVDATFDRRGKVMTLPADIDPDVVLHQFDRPDDVAVVPDASGSGRHGLCRKEDLGRVIRRAGAVARVLARHGMRTRAEFGLLPKDAQQRILAEVEEELDRDD